MVIPNTPFYFAQQNTVYAPAYRDILSISNSFPASVVTTFNGINPGSHGYQTGLIVRIDIPRFFGMEPPATMNGTQGTITVTSPTSFTINLDTTNWGVFVIPTLNPGHSGTPAQVVPIGQVTAPVTQSFINVLRPQ